MTLKTIIIWLSALAFIALGAGAWYGYQSKPLGRWAVDQNIAGAEVQLWFTFKVNGNFESQIACSAKGVQKSAGMPKADAVKACRLIISHSSFFETLLASPAPKCSSPATDKNWLVKYRGTLWGKKVDRLFSAGPCRQQLNDFSSSFTLSKLLAPQTLRDRGLGPALSTLSTEDIKKARRADQDPRPSPDRIYPCPEGVVSTSKVPCRSTKR